LDDLERRIQGLPKVFNYPLLSQERVKKATAFKFGRYIHRVHPNKRQLHFLGKGSVGVSRDCAMFLSTPYYLRTSNLVDTFTWTNPFLAVHRWRASHCRTSRCRCSLVRWWYSAVSTYNRRKL